jgi:hypothetical protein
MPIGPRGICWQRNEGQALPVLPNPQMQPTGRGGPAFLAGAAFPVAR